MWKIIKAIVAGKSREEVYDMLSEDDRQILISMSSSYGITRQQRRKQERDAKRKVHR